MNDRKLMSMQIEADTVNFLKHGGQIMPIDFGATGYKDVSFELKNIPVGRAQESNSGIWRINNKTGKKELIK